MKAIIKKVYLTEIPHEGGNIAFQYPAFDRYYGNIAEGIDKEGLERPKSSETASLIYDAFQKPEGEYESKIIQILHELAFFEFTGNLYLPKSRRKEEVHNGIILETNPKITNGGMLNMDKQSLIKRLQNNDPLVKFVPFGYKVGEQTSSELIKNPYIVARYGEEGAQKIAEISSKFKSNPELAVYDSVEGEYLKMSVLSGRWGRDRLDIGGLCDSGAFGIRALGKCKK
jgi:hypothetical protein